MVDSQYPTFDQMMSMGQSILANVLSSLPITMLCLAMLHAGPFLYDIALSFERTNGPMEIRCVTRWKKPLDMRMFVILGQ